MKFAAPVQIASEDMLGAKFRIHLTYLWRHRRLLSLRDPKLFTELVQHRKLYDRDLRLPNLADKSRVKALVTERLGDEWVVPTLWSGTVLPDAPEWRAPFVLKSTHGANQSIFVRDETFDWPAIRERAHRWLRSAYGGWLDEWLYSQIPPGLIVEPFVGIDGVLPLDYKFYVFGGRVEFIQVHFDREHAHRWRIFDRVWRPVGREVAGLSFLPPTALSRMIDAAEELGRTFDFVRIDLYQPSTTPLFGEMTFYPGSGLDPFDPPELDAIMGELWLGARRGPVRGQIGAGEHGLLPSLA
ncbi:ATP-grasp fold amidoligase family protein [soil metagenome]